MSKDAQSTTHTLQLSDLHYVLHHRNHSNTSTSTEVAFYRYLGDCFTDTLQFFIRRYKYFIKVLFQITELFTRRMRKRDLIHVQALCVIPEGGGKFNCTDGFVIGAN